MLKTVSSLILAVAAIGFTGIAKADYLYFDMETSSGKAVMTIKPADSVDSNGVTGSVTIIANNELLLDGSMSGADVSRTVTRPAGDDCPGTEITLIGGINNPTAATVHYQSEDSRAAKDYCQGLQRMSGTYQRTK